LRTKNIQATKKQSITRKKKQEQIFLNYKAPQNANQEQIFEKRRMRSKIDLIDKWRRREEDSSMQ
jgi:hypothetical protein